MISLSFNQNSVRNSNNTELGQLPTSGTIVFKPHEIVGGDVVRGQRFKLALYANSGGSITGTVDFGFKPPGIGQLQLPANNQLTIENDQPIVLTTAMEIEEITLTAALSAIADWRLDLFN